MGICAQCTFFRRVKPASGLLARDIATTDAAVSNALTKIVEDEQKQRDAEAEFKRSQATGDNDIWGTRPVMSDYCGFKESDGLFLIAEVKNFGGRCSDFVAGRPARRACADCRHRVLPRGPREDFAEEKELMGWIGCQVVMGQSSSVQENQLVKYREGVASRKVFELSSVYAAQGVLATKPKYFDYCAALSHDDEFVSAPSPTRITRVRCGTGRLLASRRRRPMPTWCSSPAIRRSRAALPPTCAASWNVSSMSI